MKFVLLHLLFGTLSTTCTVDKLIDDFRDYPGYNALGGYHSDDGSCNSTTASNHILSILPGSHRCYFYTNYPQPQPADAIDGIHNSIRFAVTAPIPNWSFKMNLKSWNGYKLADSYYTVSGTAAGETLINAPFSRFNGPDVPALRNMRSFVFESFSDTSKVWKIGEIDFPCTITSISSRTSSSTTRSSSSRSTSRRTSATTTRSSSARTTSTRRSLTITKSSSSARSTSASASSTTRSASTKSTSKITTSKRTSTPRSTATGTRSTSSSKARTTTASAIKSVSTVEAC